MILTIGFASNSGDGGMNTPPLKFIPPSPDFPISRFPSGEGVWIVDHTTTAIVALMGFLFGFTSMFRRASRKFPTHF